jgi:hypothetical protein
MAQYNLLERGDSTHPHLTVMLKYVVEHGKEELEPRKAE